MHADLCMRPGLKKLAMWAQELKHINTIIMYTHALSRCYDRTAIWPGLLFQICNFSMAMSNSEEPVVLLDEALIRQCVCMCKCSQTTIIALDIREMSTLPCIVV